MIQLMPSGIRMPRALSDSGALASRHGHENNLVQTRLIGLFSRTSVLLKCWKMQLMEI